MSLKRYYLFALSQFVPNQSDKNCSLSGFAVGLLTLGSMLFLIGTLLWGIFIGWLPASVGLLQFCLTPHLPLFFDKQTVIISHHVAILLSVSAIATPGYQLLLNEPLFTDKSAGLISTNYTLGYGLSALAVPAIAGFCRFAFRHRCGVMEFSAKVNRQ
ncbi:hypothetical protein [Xenorhabdus hominickii]|uniref:MFS transporter n=1 Tax=Xenorhabdus hominickii TaxID=351679 RepID=A0A2G0QAB0_XENHO|nr:hypothetical protein [Xenorhabdus hominickii]AOM40885.1 hypothetical protein A9255_09990 [Xenorhabdus hominickii]PHM56148.1 MFS transporter [Xenorhabdus hominickii]